MGINKRNKKTRFRPKKKSIQENKKEKKISAKKKVLIAIYSPFSGYDKGEQEILGKFTFSEGFRDFFVNISKKVETPREKVVFPEVSSSPYVIP